MQERHQALRQRGKMSEPAQEYRSASASSSKQPVRPAKPAMMRRQTTSTRRVHRRRASQPVPTSIFPRTSPVLGDDVDTWAGSSSTDDGGNGGSSSDDEDFYWEDRRDMLDYLDLSLTLPYTLVALRQQILSHCSQLEQRVRSLCSLPSSPKSESTSSGGSKSGDDNNSVHSAATFYAHLEALKDDLRRLATSLPASASSLSFPLTPQRASAAIAARRQSLAQDWERLSAAVQVSLPLNSDLHLALQQRTPNLPALPTFSLLADIDFGSVINPLSAHLPQSGLRLLDKIQTRFEALQDSVSALTLRDCFYWSRTGNEEAIDPALTTDRTISRPSNSRRLSLSQQHLARQFESIFESIKSKGEEVRLKGHASAASVAKAAKDTEERLYLAAVELARGGQKLIRYEHLPTLWQNNEHILSGYRFIPISDTGALLRSTFQIHNETGNIFTHLLGALVVIPLFWPSRANFDEQTTPMDRMVQTIYLGAALHCLVLSVCWHVMAGCSDAFWFEKFACVDYTGIAWLVAASVWTLVYNAFYCQPNLAMFYSLTTLLVGAIGAIVPWAAWFNDRKNKPIRIAIFLTMCFTGVGPFLHASLSHGFVKTSIFFSPILPSVAAYIFGLVFYATQFPERIAPGRFDVVGHAHQIWHVSIVVAILLHYRATHLWHAGRFDFSCSFNPLQQSSLSSSGTLASAFINNVGSSAAEMASQLSSTVFGQHSALQKAASDLNIADDIVHGWRISAGKLGDGMVGRVWDWCVDRIMETF